MTTALLLLLALAGLAVLVLILLTALDSRRELEELNTRVQQIDTGLVAERNMKARWRG